MPSFVCVHDERTHVHDSYSALSVSAAVPTLVLPPQAGHASSIVDYGRDQSQMITLRDAG